MRARWAPHGHRSLFSGSLSCFQVAAAPRQLPRLVAGPLLPRHRLLLLRLHSLLASPRLCFVLQLDCRLFKCRARLCPPCDWRPGQSSAHTGRWLDAQWVTWLLPLPPAQGTCPCPRVFLLYGIPVFHPRGFTRGPAVVSTPRYLFTASLAFVSTPCLFLPAGQPRGMVGTGRIRRKEPPLCAERSRTLPHWAAAPRKETQSRGAAEGEEPGWGSSWRVWAHVAV